MGLFTSINIAVTECPLNAYEAISSQTILQMPLQREQRTAES